MGSIVDFECRVCGYQSEDIAIGQGKDPKLRLQLFSCAQCKSIGSNWVSKDQALRCSFCYHNVVEEISEQDITCTCPKCGETGVLQHKDQTWE